MILLAVIKKLRNLSMWQKILMSLLLGIIAGLLFQQRILIVKPLGQLFIRAIHMIVVPVVFSSIVNAVLHITDMQTMRRLISKALCFYAASMFVAAAIGAIITTLINPGMSLHLIAHNTIQHSRTSLGEFFINIIPDNPIHAFYHGNILQILVFAVLFGVAINLSVKKGSPVVLFFKDLSKVVIKLAGIVMLFAPFGIFALIACVIGEYGIQSLLPLVNFIACVWIGCMTLWLFYSFIIMLVLKIGFFEFLKMIKNPMLVAFTTSSSAATLPVTLQCAQQKLKIPSQIANFLLPLGTSLNMNGISVYLSAATIFAANLYGIHLGFTQYASLFVIIIFSAVGAAAVPGSALVVMGAIQSSLGIPMGAIPLIAGVDRINDMIQTSTNVASDLFSTTIINKTEEKSVASVSEDADILENY